MLRPIDIIFFFIALIALFFPVYHFCKVTTREEKLNCIEQWLRSIVEFIIVGLLLY